MNTNDDKRTFDYLAREEGKSRNRHQLSGFSGQRGPEQSKELNIDQLNIDKLNVGTAAFGCPSSAT